MTLLRGYADDLPLKQWLEEKIWVLEAKLTGEDVYWGTKLACLEMIKNGVTVFNDMYWFWEDSARAVCDMGVRGFLSAVFIDMFDPKKAGEQIEANIELFRIAEKYRPERASSASAPTPSTACQREPRDGPPSFPGSTTCPVHMHLAESEGETLFTREKYGLLARRVPGRAGRALGKVHRRPRLLA